MQWLEVLHMVDEEGCAVDDKGCALCCGMGSDKLSLSFELRALMALT